ncbi:MAG: hypothetical protein KJI71_00995 [Patescibacteria group bacterium]|nr:hypothetical protein [Patescibacteria group bacterium]
MKKNLSILIITFLLSAALVQAVAVKVEPSELRIETNFKTHFKEEIIVENPDNNVALYEVYLDNFSDWIKVEPESFILESEDSQTVILEIDSKEKGVFSTTISVVAKPLSGRKFKANSGVKIPLEVRVVEGEKETLLATVYRNGTNLVYNSKNLINVLSLILILVLGIWITNKKMKSKDKDHYNFPAIKF